ncbi:hypothetical protein BH09SUM1_BH09SUM1_12370 [soil metagenome]
MIIGIGTSHDSGLAILNEEDGLPLFAASLERISRIKADGGDGMRLEPWVRREVPQTFFPLRYRSLTEEEFFSPSNGYHALERSTDFAYRWTEPRFFITVPNDADSIILELILSAKGRVEDLQANCEGMPLAVKTRRVFQRLISLPQGEGRRVEVTVSRSPAPEDPRSLGVMIRSLAFMLKLPHASRSRVTQSWTFNRLGFPEIAGRFIYKQLVDLPRKGLRGRGLVGFGGFFAAELRRDGLRGGMRARLRFQLRGEKIGAGWDHHLCHAASAYYPSGFDRALIFTQDGFGDEYAARVMLGEGGRLKPLQEYWYEEKPLGLNYDLIVGLLDFNPARHAGKITGLAAFGKPNDECRSAMDDFLDGVWLRGKKGRPGYMDYTYREPTYKRLRAERQRFFKDISREDISYEIQRRTEHQMVTWIKEWRAKFPGIDRVALAGGVFANVRVNQKIKELGFKEIFIQPAMSDAGLCYGAALLELAHQKGGVLQPKKLPHVFLGYQDTPEEQRRELEKHGLRYRRVPEESIGGEIAKLVAARKVVAHHYGRMEFGPRALGNRSILYMAHDPDVNKWLNTQLNRTEFMPFAPAVLYEDAPQYFTGLEGAEHACEFMTITMDCTEKARHEIPAAVHVDGTARPQLVHHERNPRFHSILRGFKELTGVSSMINTSFNMHEEPIVATAYDAIRCYQLGHLDVLILGNYIVENRGKA